MLLSGVYIYIFILRLSLIITERLSAVQHYNRSNTWRKRGISVCPVKYGIGWNYYNAGVRLGVRSEDGSVVVSHSGTEIGQGINTKLAQAVAYEVGAQSITFAYLSSCSSDCLSRRH